MLQHCIIYTTTHSLAHYHSGSVPIATFPSLVHSLHFGIAIIIIALAPPPPPPCPTHSHGPLHGSLENVELPTRLLLPGLASSSHHVDYGSTAHHRAG